MHGARAGGLEPSGCLKSDLGSPNAFDLWLRRGHGFVPYGVISMRKLEAKLRAVSPLYLRLRGRYGPASHHSTPLHAELAAVYKRGRDVSVMLALGRAKRTFFGNIVSFFGSMIMCLNLTSLSN